MDKMADMGVSMGSDCTEEMFCEYCHKKEQKCVTAEGFCVNCVKYLCTTCLRYHCSLLPEHILQDKNSMPVDSYMEKCNKHPQELLKFYCITCKDIVCLTCKTTFHAACENVHHLPRLAAEFDAVKECSKLEDNLDILEREADDMKESIDNHREKVEKQNKNVIKVVKVQRLKVKKIFNNFEEEIDNLHKANKKTLDLKNTKNDLLKAEIQGLKTEVRALKNSHQKCKVYLKTKNVADKQERIAETMKDLKNQLDTDLNRYSYNKAKEEIKPEHFGKVTLKPLDVAKGNKISYLMVLLILTCAIILAWFSFLSTATDVPTNKTDSAKGQGEYFNLQTENTTDFKNISTDDMDHQSVNDGNPVLDSPTTIKKSETIEKLSLQPIALEKMPEKHLKSLPKNILLKDLSYFSENIIFSITYGLYENDSQDSSIKEHFINNNVQVHNLTGNKIIHSFHQEGIKLITKLDDKKVAATFENRVELWRITEHQSNIERTVLNTLNTTGMICPKIHTRVGNLFIMCLDLNSKQYTIKQLTLIGYEVTSFNINSDFYKDMTVSPDGKTIYVSNSWKNSVKSYTLEGHLMAEYKNDSLIKYPRKMTMDSKGNLFVTGYSLKLTSKNIFYVSPDLTHGYELIQTDKVYTDSLTYNENDNSLYISSIYGRSIKVFKIKT